MGLNSGGDPANILRLADVEHYAIIPRTHFVQRCLNEQTELRQEAAVSDADALLVAQAKKGDQKAFELLVRHYQGRVASTIARSVADTDRVRDLTQEVFIKAYRALGAFRGESAFYTWLYRIAVNTAKNYVVSASKGIPENDVDFEEAEGRVAPQLRDDNTPERQLLRAEMLKNLQAAIDSLSPAMRNAMMLRDVDGYSYEEIAAMVDCPIGTVRSRIFRGRQEVAEHMQKYLYSGKT